MAETFLNGLWTMSCQAAIAVCMVLAARILFAAAKLPKKYAYGLWAFPFLRMLLPWWIKSPLSIFGLLRAMGKTTIQNAATEIPALPGIADGPQEASLHAFQMAERLSSPGGTDMTNTQFSLAVLLLSVWAAGFLGLLAYSTLSFLIMKKKLNCCIHMKHNIYLADHIETSFVLGIFRPRIYLPSDIDENDLKYVLLHEQFHIRRKDPLIKMGAFLTASLHWFNPFAWAAFIFLCRDMEMSCDESVIGQLGGSGKREYALTLLRLTAQGTGLGCTPLAFGMGNPKGRIRHIMKYRKTTKFTAAAGMITLGLMAVLLLTNPQSASAFSDRPEGFLKLSGILEVKSEAEPGAEPEAKFADETGTEPGSKPADETGTELNTAPGMENSSGTVFVYNGREYDLTQKSPEINAIVSCTSVGPYLVVNGHIGPHNGYYGVFNTVTEEFEADLFGAHLTYDVGSGHNEEIELSDFIYSFWNDIYDGCGNLIASCQTAETEYIYNLRVENGYIYVDILDAEAGAVVRTESFPRENIPYLSDKRN